jgi:hypothetical protein
MHLPVAKLFVLAVAGIAVAATPAAAIRRQAFATSVAGSADLSSWPEAGGQAGVAAGDAICRARAAAAGLPNAGTYRAWLSTSGTDAYCHVQGLAGERSTGCGGAVLPGGGPWFPINALTGFTGSLDRLTGAEHEILRPVTTDEFGDLIAPGAAQIWTGTAAEGHALPWRCQDWSSTSPSEIAVVGDALATAVGWTHDVSAWCNVTARLLCLEPGESEPVPEPWSPAALVFVTSKSGYGDLSTWVEAHDHHGLDAGDEICRTLAREAGLPAPDSFVAWLSDSLVDARDRVTVHAQFRRLDGYHVATSKLDLIDGMTSNSIHVDEHGQYLASSPRVWTGTYGVGTGTANHCDDWSANATLFGTTGYPSAAWSGRWTDVNDTSCSWFNRLYCVANVVTIFWDGFEGNDTARWSATSP